MRSINHFIGGKEVAGTSGRSADVFNPATGEVQAKVALASKAEVRAAVENAALAQPEWANTVGAQPRLNPSDQLALAIHANDELRRQDEDEEARDESDQRRDDVDQPMRRDLVDPLQDHAGEVRKVAQVVPVAGCQEIAHQRSISPTTMSIDPSTTIASATVPPTVISLSALRLMNDGGRMWKR